MAAEKSLKIWHRVMRMAEKLRNNHEKIKLKEPHVVLVSKIL